MTTPYTAQQNKDFALAALIIQIQDFVNSAATDGQLFVFTQSLAPNQQAWLTANGYTVTLTDGVYNINWELSAQ